MSLCRYSPSIIEKALAAGAAPLLAPAADRAAWDAVRERLGAPAVAGMLARAEECVAQPVPPLLASVFTSDLDAYTCAAVERRRWLADLALATCLAYDARFHAPLLDLAWAICEESTWALPGPDSALPDMTRPRIDEQAALTGWALAELDALLGDDLDAALRPRIRYEIDRRLLQPFLTRHDFAWLDEPGATEAGAVCAAGILSAALHTEADPARLAEIAARAARPLDDYLAIFNVDGGACIGPQTWALGFGCFVAVAQLLAARTAGRVDWLAGDHLREIALFPARTLLTPGVYPGFAGTETQAVIWPGLLALLGRHLKQPGLLALAESQRGQPAIDAAHLLPWRLRDLLWAPAGDSVPAFAAEANDWLPDTAWMIARLAPRDTEALALAVKGGHNGEPGGHLDVGGFVVHWRGETLITDPPGALTGWQAHSVPAVNGLGQLEGAQARAEVTERGVTGGLDLLALELKDVYPAEAGLRSLRRVIALHRRPPGWVEIIDGAMFEDAPGMLETVLITGAQVEIVAERALLHGQRGTLAVHFDPQQVAARLETVPDAQTLQRVVFAYAQPRQAGAIRLRIEPVAAP
ncbi:MAG: hypothetical protein ACOCZH_02970 [Phototrophicaceae bacterium]